MNRVRCGLLGALVIGTLGLRCSPALAACGTWATYKGVALHRMDGGTAYTYRTVRIAIDADGAPNAYEPHDRGLDALGNAGFPNGGWRSVLAADPANPSRPYVQKSGEFAGYFVSMTTLADPRAAATDPARYVDARNVPYVVFPGRFLGMPGTGRLGVLGMARNLVTGQASPMIVADVGGRDAELGEMSVKLAENLGGQDVNPRNGRGAPRGPFAYVVFPGSEAVPPWPLDAGRLRTRAEAELAKAGGWDAVLACVGTP